jgi:outer membrane protein TolC
LADINLKLAKQTLEAEEAIADVGRALQKDVLEARNALATAKSERVKSRTDYQMAWVELQRLQGVLGR